MVSYSDFITLLFAFFVVMYSVSQVNESKYRVLSNTLMDAFSDAKESRLDPIQLGQSSASTKPSAIELEDEDSGEFTGDGAFERTADLPQLAEQIRAEFRDLIDDQLVQVRSNEFWLQVELPDSILFSSGKIEPSQQARGIFDDIAKLLGGFNNPVQVEGHTDDTPIGTSQFPSNWELSSARAAAVVKLLIEGGVAPGRLSAVGFGEFSPIADNGTEAGRRQNRRVVLMIARERIERPRVNTRPQMEEALASPQPQVSQPYPQPGLKKPATLPLPDDGLNPEEVQARLDVLLEQGGQETSTPLSDILVPETEPAEGNEIKQPLPAKPLVQVGDIKAVELEGGGLLFSSDPDLPRHVE